MTGRPPYRPSIVNQFEGLSPEQAEQLKQRIEDNYQSFIQEQRQHVLSQNGTDERSENVNGNQPPRPAYWQLVDQLVASSDMDQSSPEFEAIVEASNRVTPDNPESVRAWHQLATQLGAAYQQRMANSQQQQDPQQPQMQGPQPQDPLPSDPAELFEIMKKREAEQAEQPQQDPQPEQPTGPLPDDPGELWEQHKASQPSDDGWR